MDENLATVIKELETRLNMHGKVELDRELAQQLIICLRSVGKMMAVLECIAKGKVPDETQN